MDSTNRSTICWDAPPAAVASLPMGRRDRVQTVRQQIKDGIYDADEFFDEAVDRLLERILGDNL